MSLIPVDSAPPATEADARARADRIRANLDAYVQVLADVAAAYHHGDHRALGYESWGAYVDGEYGDKLLRVSRAERPEVVATLRAERLSTRAIAAVVGVDQKTVVNDLHRGEENSSPALVAGIDGKTYGTSRPESEYVEAELIPDAPTFERIDPATIKFLDPLAAMTADERTLWERLMAGETIVATMRGLHDRLIQAADARGLYVRIDRRTDWGNHFEFPADGDRFRVVTNYDEHYLEHKPSLLDRLEELRGKVLGCWCAPELCHGDVLKARLEP